MRDLERDNQDMSYALFVSKSDLVGGVHTGKWVITYGTPELFPCNISPDKGAVGLEAFGSLATYDRVISTSDMTCPINENSILWIGIPTTGKHNYEVSKVGTGIDSILFAIRKVTVA